MKGMCHKQEMAAREGKSPWRRGESRSGGKDLLSQERYDRRKKRRRIDGDNEAEDRETRQRAGRGRGERILLKKKKVGNLGTMTNNNNNK